MRLSSENNAIKKIKKIGSLGEMLGSADILIHVVDRPPRSQLPVRLRHRSDEPTDGLNWSRWSAIVADVDGSVSAVESTRTLAARPSYTQQSRVSESGAVCAKHFKRPHPRYGNGPITNVPNDGLHMYVRDV